MSRRRRWIIVILSALATVAMAAYLGLSVVIYYLVSATNNLCSQWPMTPDAYTVPADLAPDIFASYLITEYESVQFPSRDDELTISGWYIPAAENDDAAPVVILVHAAASCKRSVSILFAAGMLHKAGFTTLLIDLRDHGDSQVEDGRMAGGTDEYRDVLGAWDWLVSEKQVPPKKIGLFGTSLGAATVMIAFGEEPRVAAVWEDSSYADIDVTIRDELARNGLPVIFAPTARLLGRVIWGDDIGSKSPLLAIATAGDRPVFITHGTADRRLRVQYASDLLAEAQLAGATHVQSWIVEGSEHLYAMFDQPEEYERRLIEFFQMALGA